MARKGYQGPLPSSDFRKQVATEVLTPFTDIISGQSYKCNSFCC